MIQNVGDYIIMATEEKEYGKTYYSKLNLHYADAFNLIIYNFYTRVTDSYEFDFTVFFLW